MLYFIDFGIAASFEEEHSQLGRICLISSPTKGAPGYRIQDIVKLPVSISKLYMEEYQSTQRYARSIFNDRCGMVLTIIELMMGTTFHYIGEHCNRTKPIRLYEWFRTQNKYTSIPEWMTQHKQDECLYGQSYHNSFCSNLMTRFPYNSSQQYSIWKLLFAMCHHDNIHKDLNFFLRIYTSREY